MKKKALFFVILIFAISSVVFAGRKQVEDFFKAYEAMVVEAEKLGKKSTIVEKDLDKLIQLTDDMSKKADLIEEDDIWTEKDSQRMAKLEERFEKAMEKVMTKIK